MVGGVAVVGSYTWNRKWPGKMGRFTISLLNFVQFIILPSGILWYTLNKFAILRQSDAAKWFSDILLQDLPGVYKWICGPIAPADSPLPGTNEFTAISSRFFVPHYSLKGGKCAVFANAVGEVFQGIDPLFLIDLPV